MKKKREKKALLEERSIEAVRVNMVLYCGCKYKWQYTLFTTCFYTYLSFNIMYDAGDSL